MKTLIFLRFTEGGGVRSVCVCGGGGWYPDAHYVGQHTQNFFNILTSKSFLILFCEYSKDFSVNYSHFLKNVFG